MIIWLASGNKHKQQELSTILSGHTVRIPAEAGIKNFDPAETGTSFAENTLIKARALYRELDTAGKIFLSGEYCPVLADDSGLCVDILDGRPGIYSARYYGKESWNSDGSFREKSAPAKLKDEERNLLLLEELDSLSSNVEFATQTPTASAKSANVEFAKQTPTASAFGRCRNCRFVCAMVLLFSPDKFYLIQETMEGEIVSSAAEIRGHGGFGYDPIVYLPEMGCTVAELPEEEKNRLSHRGKAGRVLAKLLNSLMRN